MSVLQLLQTHDNHLGIHSDRKGRRREMGWGEGGGEREGQEGEKAEVVVVVESRMKVWNTQQV